MARTRLAAPVLIVALAAGAAWWLMRPPESPAPIPASEAPAAPSPGARAAPADEPRAPLPAPPPAARPEPPPPVASAAPETGNRITGTVRDPDGRPLGGARVLAGPESRHPGMLSPPKLYTTADADGRYVLEGVTPGQELWLRAEADELLPSDPVTARAGATGVDLALRLPGALLLLVVDPAGAPVTVSQVTVETLVRGARGRRLDTRSGRTTRIPRLEPGRCRVHVEASGFLDGSQEVEIRAGVTTEAVLRLEPGCTVAGTVVDHAGAPLAGVRVWARRSDDRQRPARGNATTDVSGRFRIQGLNGSLHDLRCEPDGHDAVTVKVLPVVEPAVPETTIVVARRGVVTARVRLPDAFPPPGRILVISPVAQGSTEERASSIPWEEGLVEVEDLPVGALQLRFVVKGLAAVTRSVQMPPGGRVDLGELVFGRGLALAGQVLDARGAAVAGANVSAGLSHPASFQSAVSAADGTFLVECLTEGSVDVQVEAEGFLPARAGANVRPGAEPVIVRLERGGLLKGEVRCDDGAAATSTLVSIDGPTGSALRVWSDREGRFQARLVPGSYRVLANPAKVVFQSGGPRSPVAVEVLLREGEETPATVRVSCPGRR